MLSDDFGSVLPIHVFQVSVSTSWEAIADSSGLLHGIAFNYVAISLILHLFFSTDAEGEAGEAGEAWGVMRHLTFLLKSHPFLPLLSPQMQAPSLHFG